MSYGYDSNGEQTSVTTNVDASTTRTSYTDYYSDGTVLAQVDPAGNTTSNSYDLAGNPTAVYSPDANAGDLTANPNHLPVTYSYFDDNLLRTSSTPTLSDGSRYRLTTYGYDGGGRKLSVDVDYTTSGGSVTTNGSPQTFSYYNDDRLAGSGGRGSGTQTYSYDPAGNLTSGSDNSGGSTVTTTASYYLNGLPRSVSENSTTTTYSYDATGAVAGLQSVTSAGTLTATYGYTDAEQPATVTGGTLGAGVTMSVGYDDQQRPVSASYTSGPTLSKTWNADSTLAAQTLTAQGGGSVSTWNYGYDGMGRVLYAGNNTASTDCVPSQPAAGLQCFTYDAAGRLGSFHDSSAARSMSYDADSNRKGYGVGVTTSTCTPATGVVCADYNPDDSIKRQSSGAAWNTYSYAQPFGGVTNDGCSTYSYDGFDRLASTAGIAGTACAGKGTSDASDILDRQARRTDTSTGVTTTLGYAGLGTQPTSEATSSGTTRYTVSPDGGMPLAVSTASAAQYLFDDGRGNITTATSTSGALACALRYDPWGSFVNAVTSDGCTNAGGTTPSDMFCGAGRRDATTGNYQLGSRTYDPGKAGFLNPDGYRTAPSAADLSVGTDPLTRDTYNYVNGDPINLIDPSGHMNASEGGGGCGKMSNTDCRRLEDWVAEAVTVEYLNQANAAGIRAQQRLDKEAYERKHRCDGWGHFTCAASAVADVAETGAKVGVNFVGGLGAGIIDEATSMVTFGTYDPGFEGCAFGGGGVVGGACTAGRVTGRVGVELAALAGSGGAAGALDAVRAARAVNVVRNIASKVRVVAKLRTVETAASDARRVERAVEEASEGDRALASARSSCGLSFSADTRVVLANGKTEAISKLVVGEKVLSTDTRTGKNRTQTVEAVLVNHDIDLLDLVVAEKNGRRSVVHTTAKHPIWDTAARSWVRATAMHRGRLLHTPDGQTLRLVQTFTPAVRTGDMWDLTVSRDHDFYVAAGATSLLVHNCNGGPTLKGPIPNEEPANLAEQMVMDSAKAGNGDVIIRNLGDAPRLIANYGAGTWVKMEAVARGLRGNATVHWFRNLDDPLMNFEFKFTSRYPGFY